MWFIPAKLKTWGVTAPKTLDEFLKTCATLKSKGLATPLSVGEGFAQQHLWESVALGTLGAEGYANLWNGKLKFNDPKVVKVWDTFGKVMDCANKDASGLSWQQATDRVVEGKAAFNIMGDWAAGYLTTTKKLKPGTGFGWAAAPGTNGTFMMLSDSFGLPKGTKNRTEAMNWLKLLGSKEGQDVFNPLKGSIAARLDSDLSKYNAYLQSAAKDWKTNKITASVTHGAATNETFMNSFGAIVDSFVASRNAAGAAAAMQQIAVRSKLGQ